jgi:indole-3-glycerol phosphate synthase
MTQETQPSFLDTILAYKREVELPARKRLHPLVEVRQQAESMHTPPRAFAAALSRADDKVALIAEIKRASPSKGELVKGVFQPVQLACLYESNGAAAISVLTDERFFKGSLDYLVQVRQAVQLPVLRKDFVVDPYQLYEARAVGADAVLLIVAALDAPTLVDLYQLAHSLSLATLVEVHNETEMEQALNMGARVIGINNRDLRTFVTDLQTTARCAALTSGAGNSAPILVSESGVFTPADAARVAACGVQAILVGESLITAADTAAQVRALAQVSRPR